MQRMLLLISTLLALYVSGFASATAEVRAIEKPSAHIALLLPLKSPVFGAAADALLQGFQAAEQENLIPGKLPVRVYACLDETKEITALYRQAINNGARAVAGPLTRSGVSALAASHDIPIPTLALNIVEGYAAEQLYFFGMALEEETRQVAQLARRQGLHRAIVITTPAPLSSRLQIAFEEEWLDLGGTIQQEIEFIKDPAMLTELAPTPDTAVFLAADAENARLIRPYLSGKLMIFATSQIFGGNSDTLTNYDLTGIRFMDMPWLLQPDHPAVMVYPRPAAPLSIENERLYALGIDAYRLIQLLLSGKTSMPLDGVSGQIELLDHTFLRVSIPAIFSQGKARLPQALPIELKP
jgi:uncharacterized protein